MTHHVLPHPASPVPLVAPGSIVVGVDDRSDSIERALWEAALWAARHQTDITLLTAVGRQHAGIEVSESFRGQRAAQTVRGAAHRLARSTDVRQRIRTSVVDRSPIDALIAASADAGLIVLQRRERRAGARLRVGPTTAAVLAHAGCPILVVHADDQIVMRRGVLVVIDTRGPVTSGLATAFDEARVRGVPLTVSECQTGPRGIVPVRAGGWLALDRIEAEIATEITACRRRFPDVRLNEPVLPVTGLNGLLDLARDCELLVVATPGPDSGARGPSLTTRHLIAETGCPVLVVPAEWTVADAVPAVTRRVVTRRPVIVDHRTG